MESGGYEKSFAAFWESVISGARLPEEMACDIYCSGYLVKVRGLNKSFVNLVAFMRKYRAFMNCEWLVLQF